jgi:hypothetical protein
MTETTKHSRMVEVEILPPAYIKQIVLNIKDFEFCKELSFITVGDLIVKIYEKDVIF